MIGIENYKFGRKNNWRRTVWNEICRRTKNKKNARILYLAGEQDLDREVAKQKGFDVRNMIAIEMDSSRAQKLRTKGVTTICADLLDVLYCWPPKHKVDVVVADFCFGFEMKCIDLYDSLYNPALNQAACVVNFQRGRDKSSNQFREYLGQPAAQGVEVIDGLTMKHRAWQFLLYHAIETAEVFLRGPDRVYRREKDKTTTMVTHDIKSDMEFAKLVGSAIQNMNPEFYSYRSGRIFMDSAVFSHGSGNQPRKIRRLMAKDFLSGAGQWAERNKELQRKIVAAIAVQSRKKAAA